MILLTPFCFPFLSLFICDTTQCFVVVCEERLSRCARVVVSERAGAVKNTHRTFT